MLPGWVESVEPEYSYIDHICDHSHRHFLEWEGIEYTFNSFFNSSVAPFNLSNMIALGAYIYMNAMELQGGT